jgi:uncharacterized protein
MQKKPAFKRALVTGASSGIGEALSLLLAEQGIDLIVSGRNQERLENLAERIKDKVNVEIVPADLAVPSKRESLIATIRRTVPDLVINNAGFGLYGEALKTDAETQMHILEVDAAAVLELSLESARAMVAAGKKGVILNVSSAAAFQVFPCFAVYAASKAFVNQFSLSFDEEMRHYGIRVLAACPGVVATKFRLNAGGTEDRESSEPLGVMSASFAAKEIWQQIQQRKPLHIFDWKYRILTFLSRLFPRRWVANAVRTSIEKRMKTKTPLSE